MDTTSVTRRALLGAGLGAAGGLALTTLTAQAGHAAYPVRRLGDGGAVVRALQQLLAERGYWCGTPDGYFGHLTLQAVWALQKANDLTVDGVVGHRSLLALSRAATPAPQTIEGPGVEVDLARQLLVAVSPEGWRIVLNTSTGNGEPYDYYGREVRAITPPGRYAVYSTYTEGWQPGPLGDLYRPQYFTGAIAVHGSEEIPPFPASHGCCRVSVAAMDMMWSTGLMTLGTPVTVV